MWKRLKKALFIWQGTVGCFFIFMAHRLWSNREVDPVLNEITSAVLLTVGCACVIFSAVSFMLRNDPEIWL